MERRQLLKGGMAGVLTLWASPLLQAGQRTATAERRSHADRHDLGAGRRRQQHRRPLVRRWHRARGHRSARQRRPGDGRPERARREHQGPHGLQYPLPPRADREQRRVCRGWREDRGARPHASVDERRSLAARSGPLREGASEGRLADRGVLQYRFHGRSAGSRSTTATCWWRTRPATSTCYFKDSNVLAVGDVASPVNDPELDWITGAWIGGRVSAMDRAAEDRQRPDAGGSGDRPGDDMGRVQGGT